MQSLEAGAAAEWSVILELSDKELQIVHEIKATAQRLFSNPHCADDMRTP